ncbi:photosystem I assembly BtpA [Coriobacterium glomerans PW2]|uniref:Photosystem I assembly BtpA n=1 Tax=Coriobacterium glomerans (strain ATCC 49209 / DSM 20642 / JCM 10262 / PW2) TaxID=700015 RepID=F2N7K9_CORGP|nr:BtpA/SgcQ family protein [Coriobacterium glomerans]AEB06825.1 photosystem I assembly BtpA [Coriobacterium glomerans PW2]
MSFLAKLFGTEKPVIGLLHLRPLPGDPRYYPDGSVSRVCEAAKRDLAALQDGGVDGILVTNEFSLPYERRVSPVTIAAMAHVIGTLQSELSTPWGAEAIYDGDATIELCAAVNAKFSRCLFAGAWVGDLGVIDRDVAATMRLKSALRLDGLRLFHFVTSEGEVYLNDRTTSEITESLMFNCSPDALVVGGSAAGKGPSGLLVDGVRKAACGVPVLCGTGCRESTIAEVFCDFDGAFVGTCLKRDGRFDAPIDPVRVGSFMAAARSARREKMRKN